MTFTYLEFTEGDCKYYHRHNKQERKHSTINIHNHVIEMSLLEGALLPLNVLVFDLL